MAGSSCGNTLKTLAMNEGLKIVPKMRDEYVNFTLRDDSKSCSSDISAMNGMHIY